MRGYIPLGWLAKVKVVTQICHGYWLVKIVIHVHVCSKAGRNGLGGGGMRLQHDSYMYTIVELASVQVISMLINCRQCSPQVKFKGNSVLKEGLLGWHALGMLGRTLIVDGHLWVDVFQSLHYLPEQPPHSVITLLQVSGVNQLAKGLSLTILHLWHMYM